MARILVIIEKGEHSYGAYSPDVPGCVAVGETREEVEQLMREALQLHFERRKKNTYPCQSSKQLLSTWKFPFQLESLLCVE